MGASTARSSWCAAPPPARAASVSPATTSAWAARAASSARSRVSTRGASTASRCATHATAGRRPEPDAATADAGDRCRSTRRSPRRPTRPRRAAAGRHLRDVRRHVHRRPALRGAQPRGRRGSRPGMMIDDLVIIGADPGASDVPVHYEFEEGEGTVGGQHRRRHLGRRGDPDRRPPAGPRTASSARRSTCPAAANANAVDLPDNLLQGEADFTTSFWVRPDAKANWIGMFHIGDGLARRRQLLPDPDADPGGRQHRPGGDLQGEGQPRPGARLRHSHPGRRGQRVEPRGLHPPGRDRHALPQRRADRHPRRPDDRHDRRRSDGEQLAGSQRLPRPGVRRPDGRRAGLHLDAQR